MIAGAAATILLATSISQYHYLDAISAVLLMLWSIAQWHVAPAESTEPLDEATLKRFMKRDFSEYARAKKPVAWLGVAVGALWLTVSVAGGYEVYGIVAAASMLSSLIQWYAPPVPARRAHTVYLLSVITTGTETLADINTSTETRRRHRPKP